MFTVLDLQINFTPRPIFLFFVRGPNKIVHGNLSKNRFGFSTVGASFHRTLPCQWFFKFFLSFSAAKHLSVIWPCDAVKVACFCAFLWRYSKNFCSKPRDLAKKKKICNAS
jgi:hypothetical protein